MDTFPWWTEKQKRLSEEVEEFVEENTPRATEALWKFENPDDLIKKVAEKGWFGTLIPEEYGGMGSEVGVTGACIVAEGLARLGPLTATYSTTCFGGTHQLVRLGTPEQKDRWLPKIARGEQINALCLTEPFVGSDAAGVTTRATRVEGGYLINGKKRFISTSGIADNYFVYVKTSDEPGDRASYKHLTGLYVQKGMPGFTVERVNALAVFDAVRNGVLNFKDVFVPEENVVGGEGMGWMCMISGLNLERTLIAVSVIAGIREALRYSYYMSQRRVQFGQRTIEFESNQYRIADMIIGYKTARLLAYYAASLLDQGAEPLIEANSAKIYATETARKAAEDALQVMGGDGFTKYYPIETTLRDSKILEVGGGTNDVLRRLISNQGWRIMRDMLKPPRRRVHEKLGIPIPYFRNPPELELPTKTGAHDPEAVEKSILLALAEDYRVNPGLHLTREELIEDTGLDDEHLDEALLSLEEKNLVDIYRDKKGILRLVKATYAGLEKVRSIDYFRWYPEWLRRDEIF
jgi:alkylation response protein AidB-like acyl-CoA dehydrogenase/DNA-binding transcriptional ArsR family regulator